MSPLPGDDYSQSSAPSPPSDGSIEASPGSTVPSFNISAAAIHQSTTPSSPTSNNRQRLNQRVQKYRLTRRLDLQCDGPQHAQRWKCFCYAGTILVGCSDWKSSKDAAREEAAGHALEWFDQYGYP
jgi:hypothetical protein